MSKKSVLHELLAVEKDLDGAHKKILDETKNTFLKKSHHFMGQHRVYEPFDDDDKVRYPEEFKKLDTTVDAKLKYMSKTEIRYFNVMLQKEATNQDATADLVVDGVVIATGLPATFLLGMETRLKHLRSVYETIPTLSPGIEWVEDASQGANIYVTARPEEKLKTSTDMEFVIAVEPTEHHPAQIREVSKTKNVGKYSIKLWSGMVSPAQKSVFLGRIDKLIRAFKKARQRANTAEVVKRTVGRELFEYIHGNLLITDKR